MTFVLIVGTVSFVYTSLGDACFIKTQQEKILANLFENQLAMDFTMQVPDDPRQVKAHRIILIGASRYLEKRFLGAFSVDTELDWVTLDIPGLNYETLQMLITFIYTQKLSFTDKCTVPSAVIAADYLLIETATAALNEYILDNIRLDTACEFYLVADRLPMQTSCTLLHFIRKHLFTSKEYLTLNYEQFRDVIRDRSLFLDDDILSIIKDWVLAEPARNQYSLVLLSGMRNCRGPVAVSQRCVNKEWTYFDLLSLIDSCNNGSYPAHLPDNGVKGLCDRTSCS